MHRKTWYCFLRLLSFTFLVNGVLNGEPEVHPIVPVVDTQGMIWHDDWHYITYMLVDETTQQLMFRTYPFTTIDKPGFYTLATNVANQITITASDVTLDMNGCTVSGGASGIVINSGLSNVTIRNGTITGVADGILVNASCKDITIKQVTAKNCIRGITCDEVNNGIISHCDLMLNTTGLQIDTSHNIYVEHCTAHANLQAGYSLLTSTTCTLTECTVLATGDGNTNLFGNQSNVFGFVTSSGMGNVFERCIANSTQALTATSSETVVAGFALRGTESCSKIIGCEAGDGMSSPNGATIPYGILLESRFDALVTVTSANQAPTTASASATTWSPDGQYLAVAHSSTGFPTRIVLYRFDRALLDLTSVFTVVPGNNDGSFDGFLSMAWSPDGQYLAAGGLTFSTTPPKSIYVYRFDQSNETLNEIITLLPIDPDTHLISSLSWSPDGQYLAAGATFTVVGPALFLYRFDKVAQTLTLVDTKGDAAAGDTLESVAWSPDGNYLATGGIFATGSGMPFIMYRFDRTRQTLTEVDAVDPNMGLNTRVTSVAWTTNGQYLAVGEEDDGSVPFMLFLYKFNRSTQRLVQLQAIRPAGAGGQQSVKSVNWSANSGYLVIGGVISTAQDVFLYKFNRSIEQLTQIATANPGASANNTVEDTIWSPDGKYIAIVGTMGVAGDNIFIYSGLNFPSHNVITDNTVYCDAGSNSPGGVGISGSSIANLIISNTASSNPMTPAIVPSNYEFVCNVFNPLFGDAPTTLQNLSINNKVPIPSRFDVPAGLNRLEVLVQSLVDNLL